MSYTAEQPIQYTPDPSKFGALAGGKVWFGVPNGNPASVPGDRIQVYLARQGLADLAIAQPIDIGPGGVWYYNGSPAQIKVLVPYCVQILNSLGVQKFYAPAAGDEIAKFNEIDSILNKAITTVATYADISAALNDLEIGQQFSLVGHTFAGFGGGIFDVVSSSGLTANNGTIVINGAKAARRSEKKLTTFDFGAPIDGVSSCVSAFLSAYSVVDTLEFLPGYTYCFDDEIKIDKNFTLIFPDSNEYLNNGAILKATFNDAGKSIFKVGSVNKVMQFNSHGIPKVVQDAALSSFSGFNIQSATTYMDGLLGSANINALYVSDSYIGRIRKVSGPGKSYLIKIDGNTSLAFDDLNLSGTSGGLATMQIVATDGVIDIKNVYLEAQSNRNVHIFNNQQSVINIQNIYAENSANYDILCDQANNVTVDCYRTNTNTKSVVVRQSKCINIKNVIASSRLEKYEIMDVDYISNAIYVGGVMFSNAIDYGGGDTREYVLMRGGISGAKALSAVINPELDLSASGTVSTVGGSGISVSVPADVRYVFNNSSITVNNSNPLQIPIVDWRQGEPIVVQCIYKTADIGATDFTIGVWRNTTNILLLQEFHAASAEFQLLTFVAFMPKTTIDQYSSLEFRCASGKTATVHYLSMSYYDGDKIPVGALDNSVVFSSDDIDLNTLGSSSVLIPHLGSKNYRLKQYEMVCTQATGAGSPGVVSIGDLNTVGAIPGAYATFATDANKNLGYNFTGLLPGGPYPFRDHLLATANGWGATVSTAATHGGKAKIYIRAKEISAKAL